MKALVIAMAMAASGTTIEQKVESCAPIAEVARDVMSVYQAGVSPDEILKTCVRVYGIPSAGLCAHLVTDAKKVEVEPWEEQKVILVDMFQKRWLRKCVVRLNELEKQQ